MIIIESNKQVMPHLIVVFVIHFCFFKLSRKISREIFQESQGLIIAKSSECYFKVFISTADWMYTFEASATYAPALCLMLRLHHRISCRQPETFQSAGRYDPYIAFPRLLKEG
jgi:hypothetical protein